MTLVSNKHLRAAVGIAIAGLSLACNNQGNQVASLQPQDALCSTADTMMVRDRGLDSNAIKFAKANGYDGWCIPEFDDDQRWHDGGSGNEYGPIAHVLAAPRSFALTDPTQFDGAFVQVAIIELETEPTPSPVPYQRMGLGQYNCVYLHRRTSPQVGFEAAIVPPSMPDLHCPGSVASAPGGPPLDVTVDTPVSDLATDYPATARFIEGDHGHTLVSVRCANRWCAIGPRGIANIPRSAHDTVPALASGPQGRVKGWFDDQVLGVPDGAPRYHIHRKVRASAIPDRNLGNLIVQNFIVPMGQETYQVVGKVYFPEAPDPDSKYVKVFGFSKGTNIVAMRAEKHPSGTGVDTVWFTQVTNANNRVTQDIKTRRTDHSKYFHLVYGTNVKIPATMRWRWDDKDEDLWAECDMGCCRAGIQ